MSTAQDITGKRYARHGYSRKNNGIYRSWQAIQQRCKNPNNPDYKNYGGRGIKVCDRWLIAANFLADMGPRPDGWTIERIDNNGDYEPGNCKWIPKGEQAKNQRKRQSSPFTAEHKANISTGLKLLYATGWRKHQKPLTAEHKAKIAESNRRTKKQQREKRLQAASSSSE